MSGLKIDPRGFTFIELLVVLAALFVMLSGAHSWLANQNIRSKISEALSVAEQAKTRIVITCSEDMSIKKLTSANAGIDQRTSTYVESVTVSGPCSQPRISLQTANTGLLVDPLLTISGDLSRGRPNWSCTSTGLDVHTPQDCRVEQVEPGAEAG